MKITLQLLVVTLLLLIPLPGARAGYPPNQPDGFNSTSDATADTWVYLPLLNTPNNNSSSPAPQTRRVNAPFINPASSDDPLRDSAIFWFGKVTPDENYTDVRVRYEVDRLVISVEVFDRQIWYDKAPIPDKAGYPNWDSVSLLLKSDSSSAPLPTVTSYRIDAMIRNRELAKNYQAVYKGNGTGWEAVGMGSVTESGWRGEGLNGPNEDRGWTITYNIPYIYLGLSHAPVEGTLWNLGFIIYDRDENAGGMIEPGRWPEDIQLNDPRTWGELYFGIPKLQPGSSPATGSVMIRQYLEGATVPDAAVGGTVGNQCPGDSHFIWNEWGFANFAEAPDINIQNQADVADWPCFAKYYVTFPLDQIPPGKVIKSAALILHHWGNNGPPNLATDSIIHVLSVSEAWDEATITWNNAPLALENIDRIRIPVLDCTNGTGRMTWPCTPRTWDVGRAVDQAYQNGQPVRLALYSSDTARHSGKLFTTSDVEDWNETGRPTLVVTYGDR